MTIIKKLLKMFKPHYSKGAVIGLLVLISSLISVGMPYFYKLIIDDGILQGNFPHLLKWLSVIVFLLILKELFYIVQVSITLSMRKEMFSTIRKDLYQQLMRMSQSFYAKTHTGRLLSRITSDVDALEHLMLEKFIYFLQNMIISLFILGIIFYINWRMVLVTAVFIPLLYAMYLFFSKRIKSLSKALQEKKENVMETLKEDFSLVKVLQSYAAEDSRFQKTNEQINEMENAKKSLSFQYTKSASSTLLITVIGILVIWGYGGYEVIQKRMSLGTLVAISFYINYIQNIFFSAYYTVTDFHASIPAAERIFEILEATPDIMNHPEAVEFTNLDGDVVFKNVSFGYDKKMPILCEMNFCIHKDEIVAITGISGAGKSTLTNLISRFYDPDTGTIEMNGIDHKRIKLETLRKGIAIVPQEEYLFSTSIKENILMGRQNISHEQFKRATHLSGVDSFVLTLENGYDTLIGENGSLLSGGQRKRILIARAILENPYILIFDEATAHLDAENENLILDSIKQLSKGKIVFFISHKPAHLEFACKILSIYNGKLAMEKKGNAC